MAEISEEMRNKKESVGSCQRTPVVALTYLSLLQCSALHCTALYCTALHCTALHYPTLHALNQTRLQCVVLTYLYSSGRIIGGRLVDFTPHMESCTVLYPTWRAVLYCNPHGEWRHCSSVLLSAAPHCTLHCASMQQYTTHCTDLLH